MTNIDVLVKILQIYFDLIEHPKGAALMSGRLHISNYIDEVITRVKDEKIPSLEKKLSEMKTERGRQHIRDSLTESRLILEKAQKWKVRGFNY